MLHMVGWPTPFGVPGGVLFPNPNPKPNPNEVRVYTGSQGIPRDLMGKSHGSPRRKAQQCDGIHAAA